MKSIKKFSFFYDDHIAINSLTNSSLQGEPTIKNNTVTSKKTGTDIADENVLIFDAKKQTLIAAGTGSASVIIGTEEYEITILPAPISLITVTGHSLGMGSKGKAEQSVVCRPGTTYSTYTGDDLSLLCTDGAGLGYAAENKAPYLCAFEEGGIGRPGVDSALANTWSSLSGEKVWVINAAVGGSCIPEWVEGAEFHTDAVKMMNACAKLLKKEVAANHYVLKDNSLIYFSGANFVYKKVVYDDQKLHDWYDAMWKGYENCLNVDINGDAKTNMPTNLGFVTLWDSRLKPSYNYDKPQTFYMAMSKEYPYAFNLSNYLYHMQTDENVVKNFPDIDYVTQNGEQLTKPQTVKEFFADGVHLTQTGYNAYGSEIAQNLLCYLRGENNTEAVLVTDFGENTEIELSDEIHIPESQSKQIVIVPEKITASDLEITVSDSDIIEYREPGIITALRQGKSALYIKQKDRVIRTIPVIIDQNSNTEEEKK